MPHLGFYENTASHSDWREKLSLEQSLEERNLFGRTS